MNLFSDSLAWTRVDDVTGEADAPWSNGWTIFYWAVWLAWTPITACFLGQIAYGRTVREFMLVNFIFPSLFGACWMAIYGGTALHLELTGANLTGVLFPAEGQSNNEGVAFAMFEHLPLAIVLSVFYLASTFICFVTSADSNTTAMAAISSTGITPENNEGGLVIKVLWGMTVGAVAWVMITFADIDGIKIISNLGGFPAAILVLLVIVSLFRVVTNFEEFNLVDKK